jgi:hypothetical protein
MSVSSSSGKYSLETFTTDHRSTANNVGDEYVEPEKGVMSVLTIDSTDKTDENIYKCSMTNPFGSDSAFIQLVVQGICVFVINMFIYSYLYTTGILSQLW